MQKSFGLLFFGVLFGDCVVSMLCGADKIVSTIQKREKPATNLCFDVEIQSEGDAGEHQQVWFYDVDSGRAARCLCMIRRYHPGLRVVSVAAVPLLFGRTRMIVITEPDEKK